jgi:hypothetical protein
MKSILCFLPVASLFLAGCVKTESAKDSKPTNTPSAAGNPITAPVDYLGAVGKAQKSAVKTIDTVAIDQAIKMFYTEEGRFPKDLNELVTHGELPRLPNPPYGMKLDYDPKSGRIKVVPQ